MHYGTSSVKSAEALERALRHWQRYRATDPPPRPPVPVVPCFTIALSREYGANGSQVARLLGDRLNWPVYDRALLERIATEMGLHTALLESVDERHQGWFRECLEAFAPPPISAYTYVRRLVEVVLCLAAHGECVIVGRGAAQFLPAPKTLRVRLVGPLAERIATVHSRSGMTREEAALRVEQIDRERRYFVRDHFHLDPAVASIYDTVLNSSRFTLPECADLIVEGLHRFQARAAVAAGAPG